MEQEAQRLNQVLSAVLNNTYKHLQANSGKDWLKDIPNYETHAILPEIYQGLDQQDDSKIGAELMEITRKAQSEIKIITPYLIPTGKLYRLLQGLLAKKIRITVVTNSLLSTDNYFAQAGYKVSKDRLIAMGVELYEYNGPHTIHAKAAVVGTKRGRYALVGTFNLDPRSANLNREMAISVFDPTSNGVAQQLEDQFEIFRNESLLVGQNGQPQNLEVQEKRTPVFKEMLVNAIVLALPAIYHQL